MSINADEELANLPPWQITLGGTVHTARPVSWPAFRRFELAMAKATAAGRGDLLDDAHFEILCAAFPPRWHDTIRGRIGVARQIVNLTPAVKKKVLEDFFGHLASSQGQTTPETLSSEPAPSSTNGAIAS